NRRRIQDTAESAVRVPDCHVHTDSRCDQEYGPAQDKSASGPPSAARPLEQRRSSGGKAQLTRGSGGVQKTSVFCTPTLVTVQKTDVFCTPRKSARNTPPVGLFLANAVANSPLTPGTIIAVNTNGAFFNRLPTGQT